MRQHGLILAVISNAIISGVIAFQTTVPTAHISSRKQNTVILADATTTTTTAATANDIAATQDSVEQLKRTLEREYASFFSPMEREWYADQVTFDDPMTSLEGIASYEANVDMLSGKNIFGKLLFRDAGIVLHNIEGGEVISEEDGSVTITDLTTRWTLRLTFQALPWQPTARFSGVSVYNVQKGGPKGVQVQKQTDYWDSINLGSAGSYQKVNKSIAITDFLNQLKPKNNFAAPAAAGVELPYQLLRRGADYEVRRYPSFVAVQTPYERRDLGFSELGAFCSGGLNPLAPALMSILQQAPDAGKKTMLWPLGYVPPGSSNEDASRLPVMAAATERAQQEAASSCQIVTVPERVVAIGSFSDASVEPVVRKADRLLREACARDGLTTTSTATTNTVLTFAQYDAVFSMGKRRGEVWIELQEGEHPWSQGL